MTIFASRVPPVPSNFTGPIREWAEAVTRAVNAFPTISTFSGLDPSTVGLLGQPGHLAVNFASASTDSRLFVHGGAGNSNNSTGWKVVRLA